MASSDNSGFTWSIKELMPFLITIIMALSSIVTVYVNLNSALIIAQQDVAQLKREQATFVKTIDSLIKTNDTIKAQLEDVRVTLLVTMKSK